MTLIIVVVESIGVRCLRAGREEKMGFLQAIPIDFLTSE